MCATPQKPKEHSDIVVVSLVNHHLSHVRVLLAGSWTYLFLSHSVGSSCGEVQS